MRGSAYKQIKANLNQGVYDNNFIQKSRAQGLLASFESNARLYGQWLGAYGRARGIDISFLREIVSEHFEEPASKLDLYLNIIKGSGSYASVVGEQFEEMFETIETQNEIPPLPPVDPSHFQQYANDLVSGAAQMGEEIEQHKTELIEELKLFGVDVPQLQDQLRKLRGQIQQVRSGLATKEREELLAQLSKKENEIQNALAQVQPPRYVVGSRVNLAGVGSGIVTGLQYQDSAYRRWVYTIKNDSGQVFEATENELHPVTIQTPSEKEKELQTTIGDLTSQITELKTALENAKAQPPSPQSIEEIRRLNTLVNVLSIQVQEYKTMLEREKQRAGVTAVMVKTPTEEEIRRSFGILTPQIGSVVPQQRSKYPGLPIPPVCPPDQFYDLKDLEESQLHRALSPFTKAAAAIQMVPEGIYFVCIAMQPPLFFKRTLISTSGRLPSQRLVSISLPILAREIERYLPSPPRQAGFHAEPYIVNIENIRRNLGLGPLSNDEMKLLTIDFFRTVQRNSGWFSLSAEGRRGIGYPPDAKGLANLYVKMGMISLSVLRAAGFDVSSLSPSYGV
jgi:phage shock protein A